MDIPTLEELRLRYKKNKKSNEMTPIKGVRKPVISTSTTTRRSTSGGGEGPVVSNAPPQEELPPKELPPEELPPEELPPEEQPPPEPVTQDAAPQTKEEGSGSLPWILGGLAAAGALIATRGKKVPKIMPKGGINLIGRAGEETLKKGTAKAAAAEAGIPLEALKTVALPASVPRYGKAAPQVKTPAYVVESDLLKARQTAKELPAKKAAKADTVKPDARKDAEWTKNKEVVKKATEDVKTTKAKQAERSAKDDGNQLKYSKPDSPTQREIIDDINKSYSKSRERKWNRIQADDLDRRVKAEDEQYFQEVTVPEMTVKARKEKELMDAQGEVDKAAYSGYLEQVRKKQSQYPLVVADKAARKEAAADQQRVGKDWADLFSTYSEKKKAFKPVYAKEDISKINNSLLKGSDDANRNKLIDTYKSNVIKWRNRYGEPQIKDLEKIMKSTRKELGVSTGKTPSEVRKAKTAGKPAGKTVQEPPPKVTKVAQEPVPKVTKPTIENTNQLPPEPQVESITVAPKENLYPDTNTFGPVTNAPVNAEVRPIYDQADSIFKRAREKADKLNRIDNSLNSVLKRGLDPDQVTKAQAVAKQSSEKWTQTIGDLTLEERTTIFKTVNKMISEGKDPTPDSVLSAIVLGE